MQALCSTELDPCTQANAPMDDVLCVAVFEGSTHLEHVSCCAGLRKPLLGAVLDAVQCLVQLATWCDFEYEINPFVVVEVAIHAQDVRMTQVDLDLHFSSELVLHARLGQLHFV